jgi:hypothetical protein
MLDAYATHFAALLPGITAGRVVPLLGAGVNLCARPADLHWQPCCGFLPSGRELFESLARKFLYPSEPDYDLARLTQYVVAMAGRGTLYDELRQVFDADHTPTSVHRFFADLPRVLPQKGYGIDHQVIITTNYDDMMEQAFQDVGEPFDVIWYVADGRNRGKFMHRIDQGEVRLIESIKEYQDIDLKKRSLVLKIHGSMDRVDRKRDSYVITLNDYLEYLMRADITMLLPQELVDKLYESHFLFLGYGLRDWNLQVILHRMWGEQQLATKSWAVQARPDSVDQILWDKRNVDIFSSDLVSYVAALDSHVKALAESSEP